MQFYISFPTCSFSTSIFKI